MSRLRPMGFDGQGAPLLELSPDVGRLAGPAFAEASAGVQAGAEARRPLSGELVGRGGMEVPPSQHPATAAPQKSLRAGPARKAFRHRFSCALLREMDRRDLTVADIARLCDYTPQAVSQWIHEHNEPGGYALHRLLEVFGAEFLFAIRPPAFIPPILG